MRPLDHTNPPAGLGDIRLVQQMIEASPAATMLTDALAGDDPIVYVNAAFERLTGYPRAEVIGRNARFLQNGDRDQPDLDEIRTAIHARRACTVTLRNYRRDGTPFRNEIHIAPLYDAAGRVTHFVSVQHDVTARMQMETALRASEERYRFLAENVTDMISTHTPLDGIYTFVTPSCQALLGYAPEELVGRPAYEFFHPDDIANIEESHAAVLAGPITYTVAYRIRRKDGRYIWFETTNHLVIDPATRVPREIIAVSRDITARMAAQQREFQIALEQERLRVLTAFVRDAAHEFRTPLSTISLDAQIMTQLEDPGARAAKAHGIQQQVERTSQLVNTLLEMTSLDSAALARAPVDVGALLRQLSTACHTRHPAATLRLHIAGDLPTIEADADLLTRAICKLVDNALRYGPAHGPVTLGARCVDGALCIAVVDEGRGIPPEAQAHVFETFWRDDQAHSTPGLGLGLSIAQKIAHLHGGDITLDSTPGQGSTFTLRLPVVTPSRGNGTGPVTTSHN